MEWMHGMYLSVVAWNNVKPTINSVYIKNDLATQPYSDSSLPNSSPTLSWFSGDDKLRSRSWCFSTKQQLNARRNLPIRCLNLRFRFAAAVTAKTVTENYVHDIELFDVVCLQRFVLVSQKPVNHFFLLTQKDCYEYRLYLSFQP